MFECLKNVFKKYSFLNSISNGKTIQIKPSNEGRYKVFI